ncbi:MAG: hypothetical protein KC589_02335 [Nanoarchaeota archaeon]|nr:hypothetical protein [Nanoarchaeota archaeon]MCA9495755.1 hypothetical protein [Nanoarchaeota archaeon]
MGLFSKHNDNKGKALPAPPGAPSSNAPAPQGAGSVPTPYGPPKEADSAGSLAAPPVPGGSLSDIKSQVVGSSFPRPSVADNDDSAAPPFNSGDDSDLGDLGDDSLFDFSGLEIPEAEPSQADYSSSMGRNNSGEGLPRVSEGSSRGISSNRIHSLPEETVDSNIANEADLNFVSNKDVKHKVEDNETYFLTTSQFKSLLEIVEAVKERVKVSSDTHLRLLDIKSEEDIEYENLRKDFQFIEDKLYEVDSIIFDR